MAISEAEPPRGKQPEQAFRFGLMSDHQVRLLGRAALAVIDYEYYQGRESGEHEEVYRLYESAMAELLEQDPERAKALLKQQTLSDDPFDQQAAIRSTPALAGHDFELARDILVYAYSDQREDREGEDTRGLNRDYAGSARLEIERNVVPERSAELYEVLVIAHRAQEQIVPPGLVS